ncbi:MAG: hypothetical protein ACYDCQ_15750 [Dehalococcoidia bacterium]
MGTYCGDATIVRMDGQVLATVQANRSNQQPGADGQLGSWSGTLTVRDDPAVRPWVIDQRGEPFRLRLPSGQEATALCSRKVEAVGISLLTIMGTGDAAPFE